jgi:C1A family cysteine protease
MPRHTRKIVGYGWRPDLPDNRDLRADFNGVAAQTQMDLRRSLPAIYDQSQLGSCTANAIAKAWDYTRHHFGGHAYLHPSRLFLYFGEREIEGSIDQDAGAFGRDGFKVCEQDGLPPETMWPYDISQFAQRPPDKAYKSAARYEGISYRRVDRTLDAFGACLSVEQPFAFGFTVYESFESQVVADTGVMPLPVKGEQVMGGHEVLACGINLGSSKWHRCPPRHVICANSWSEEWGDGGYFYMPVEVLLLASMSSDFWTFRPPTQ